tara:strand:+ start:591 stop:845 length:255 start_codon:yes stop_codon:yes gene_type:complete
MNTIKDYWATNIMIKQWKESDIEKVCEIAYGDNAHQRYKPAEIIQRLQDMSNSALEWEELTDRKDDFDYEQILIDQQLERLGSV